MDPDRFFQVGGDGARRGTVLNCSRRGIVWTWRSLSLLAGFVRTEEWNRLEDGIVSAETERFKDEA